MKTKILVTGATGKAGSEVIKKLSGRGIGVRAGVHSTEKTERILNDYVEIVHLDFDKPETINTALKGIEQVLLITPPHYKQADWAVLMIDKAKELGVKKIVRLSVLAAAMEPGILLGRWHRMVERYLEGSGVDWTIVRPSPFMQNFLGMYGLRDGKLTIPANDEKVNHIDIRDVAEVLVNILLEDGHNGKKYMLTGGNSISFDKAINVINEQTGLQLTYQAIEPEIAHQALISSGKPEWLTEVLEELFAVFRLGAVNVKTSTFEDIMKRPAGSFESFVSDYKNQFIEAN